ncbi:unnamed protein product [Victoria cruziana]
MLPLSSFFIFFAAIFSLFLQLLPLPSFIPLVSSEWRAHWAAKRGPIPRYGRFRVESTLPAVRCMQQKRCRTRRDQQPIPIATSLHARLPLISKGVKLQTELEATACWKSKRNLEV